MKIRSHSESHLVELDDGSRWKIFPADLDATLNWLPDTQLRFESVAEEVSSHALVDDIEGNRVRVIPSTNTGQSKPLNTR